MGGRRGVTQAEIANNDLFRRNVQKLHEKLAGWSEGWSGRPVPHTQNGIPFASDPGILTTNEQNNVSHRLAANVEVFDLLDEGQRAAYQAVVQRIVDGKSCRLAGDRFLDSSGSDACRCLVQWADFVAIPPRRKKEF